MASTARFRVEGLGESYDVLASTPNYATDLGFRGATGTPKIHRIMAFGLSLGVLAIMLPTSGVQIQQPKSQTTKL